MHTQYYISQHLKSWMYSSMIDPLVHLSVGQWYWCLDAWSSYFMQNIALFVRCWCHAALTLYYVVILHGKILKYSSWPGTRVNQIYHFYFILMWGDLKFVLLLLWFAGEFGFKQKLSSKKCFYSSHRTTQSIHYLPGALPQLKT